MYVKDKKLLKSRMFLGLIDDEVVSISSIGVNEKKRLCHRGEIGISVKKKYWHKHIGTKMMEKIISYAKENNLVVIELQVRSDNNFIDFTLMNLYL